MTESIEQGGDASSIAKKIGTKYQITDQKDLELLEVRH
jgi:hypothetical protein